MLVRVKYITAHIWDLLGVRILTTSGVLVMLDMSPTLHKICYGSFFMEN